MKGILLLLAPQFARSVCRETYRRVVGEGRRSIGQRWQLWLGLGICRLNPE